jgi:putative Mg2+ transporter-C (MgtC) family protein
VDAFDASLHAKLISLGYNAEAIVELILAGLCGGLIGIEREVRGRQAGFRTNLLVCVGSALVMVVSNHVARMSWPSHGPGVSVNIDPARIAYGVMTGIGFIGAGTIIKHDGAVRGLTTAAGLWCVAALGLGAGLGLYTVTAVATLLILVVLWFLDYLERVMPRTHFRALSIRCRWEPDAIERAVGWVRGLGFKVNEVHFHRTPNLDDVDIDVRVAFGPKALLKQLERDAQTRHDFELIAVRES